jgi:hypothetical protein
LKKLAALAVPAQYDERFASAHALCDSLDKGFDANEMWKVQRWSGTSAHYYVIESISNYSQMK